MKTLVFQILFLLMLFVSGCKDDKNNPTDSSTGNYQIEGNWSGTTSEGSNISFRIEGNWIRELNVTINGSSQHTSSMISMIENNSFTYSTTLMSGVKLQLNGNFKSSSSSEGTFKQGTIEGTWTAAKQ